MTRPPDSIRLREAAEQLGVHYMTAYRYVRTGALPAEQRGGHWYVQPDALAAFTARREEVSGRPGRPPSTEPEPTTTALAPRQAIALAERLLNGDQSGAWRIAEAALGAGADLRQVNARLLTPALRQVGDRWAAGTASVGDEHRATVVAMRLINRLGRHFSRSGRKRGTVVLSAAPGDRHALPTAILSDLLRVEGLEVVDLGADTPAADIAAMAARQDRLVGVGICATNPLDRRTERSLRDAVEGVRAATSAPVLLGGAALDDARTARLAPDHRSVDADDATAWFAALPRPSRPGPAA